MSEIKVGTRVRLKPRPSIFVQGHTMTGGEAEVIDVSTDINGVVYRVRMLRHDRIRAARREDLVVHRDDPKRSRRI